MPASSHKVIVLILGLAAVLAGLYFAGLLRLNYPSPARFPIRGIDVSHHQGHIGWFEVSLHDVRFAYIKATEGVDFKDQNFLYNWTQCPYDGIARGAYHFFSLCQPGQAQARNFLAMVPVDPKALPPALDLEFSGNCRRRPPRPEVIREIKAFVSVLSTRYPGVPVFYVTQEFYKRYMEGHEQEFPPHRLWIRNLLEQPARTACTEWTFWQYGSLGRVPGIRGPVDLNVFCGTAEQFVQFTQKKP